MNCST